MSDEPRAPFPNRLRELRAAASLTRDALAQRTAQLAEEDASIYALVSARTLERIERGETRPRMKIASALAKVFDKELAEVFPLGSDDGMRNPTGATRIPEGRKSRGRSSKNT